MDDPRFLCLCAALAVIALATLHKALHDPKACSMHRIHPLPAHSSGFLASYRNAVGSLKDISPLIQRGYDQYPEGVFRIARLFSWKYVVCGPKLVKEVGAAPEHVLSFRDGLEDSFPTKQVMDPAIAENPYHHQTILTNLTRNLHACFPDALEFNFDLNIHTITYLRMADCDGAAYDHGCRGARQ
ncbi:hypothetical protein C8R46DRAFT_1268254 [Mycena filopes]|nr:hypothetical protein C8R46DRAFT_1268254 [Mycena filopes]